MVEQSAAAEFAEQPFDAAVKSKKGAYNKFYRICCKVTS
jgi:hypothetical protein